MLRLVAQGLSNKEIAQRLGINAETVETHLKRARVKLDATDRRDAVRKWLGDGVPNDWGPPPSGICEPSDDPPIRGVADERKPSETGGDDDQNTRPFQRFLSGLDNTGVAGRLLWMAGVAILIGLLGIGLLVAADGFTLIVHNMTATGHAR